MARGILTLSLLVEHRLGLTTITLLLSIVTTLTLGVQGGLTSLVLSDLVGTAKNVSEPESDDFLG